ncbi:MAG: Holliday junction resolvase [Spirochaetaceae bacterium]|nr:Holliday junction resolvase [Spirochaetaceae bacterium]
MEQTNILKNIASFTSSHGIIFLMALGMLILLCTLCVLLGRQFGRIEMSRNIKKERQDAVKRSKAVVAGQVYEQIAPLLPDFPCNTKDIQFIGKPIDYIGFCTNDKTGLVDEILFIEIKSGESNLSVREQSVKEVIQKRKVRYVEYRI